MHFFYKSTCSTCRTARRFLQAATASEGITFIERDMSRRPLSETELRELIGDRPVEPYLNPRNELYRERRMRVDPPNREAAFRLLAENPNLLRRPILIAGDARVLGWDEAAYRSVVQVHPPVQR